MRITKEAMLRLARDTATIRADQDRSIVCIYLTGSLITEAPFIGGSTDIDLFIIHSQPPVEKREILFLNDDVSFDIAHIEQTRFQQPRHLRADVWLGPFLCAKPKVLYDTHHWFEFTEASVAAQFYRPEYILERARPMAVAARQTWMDFHLAQPEISPANSLRYLTCIENAGNSLALLSGAPLSERRFLIDLPTRLEKVNRTDLQILFNNLVLPSGFTDLDWTQWITSWEESLKQAASSPYCPLTLSRPRLNYYLKAVTALSAEKPSSAAWVLIYTWTLAASLLPSESNIVNNWKKACATFLQVSDSFETVWNLLDELLDAVEETLDEYSTENGLSE
jgi:hypothetical protein